MIKCIREYDKCLCLSGSPTRGISLAAVMAAATEDARFPMGEEERAGVEEIRRLCAAEIAAAPRKYAYVVGEVGALGSLRRQGSCV